jgi:hypothetical protein
MDELLRDLDLLEVCCLQWRWCVEAACRTGRKFPSDRYLECRLEDMGDDLLDRVLEFCRLPPSSEVKEAFASNFRPAQPQRRIVAANQQEINRIQGWIGPTMSWLGMGPERDSAGA